MKKGKGYKNYECPKCEARWQTWMSEGELHQCYNSFAFIDYKAPIYLEKCTACWQAEIKEGGEEQTI